ncbi:MAG: hypothetical protein ACM369_00770, partial [Acidobacteriota bacterium]
MPESGLRRFSALPFAGGVPGAIPQEAEHILASDGKHGANPRHVAGRLDAVRILVVAAGAAAVWFRVWEPFLHVSVIGVATLLIGGWPIFHEAVENALQRKMTMELS